MTPSAGYDRWEPAAGGLGVACKDLIVVEVGTEEVLEYSVG